MSQISVNQAVTGVEQLSISDQRQLRSDLNLAIAVQRQMLPRNPKPLTTIRYAGISAAARGIGGDYYDFLDLGPSTLGVLLADVSGKGVAAALLMANLQGFMRCECAHEFSDLPAILQRVNAHFFGSTLPEQYATLFFARYNDWTRQVDYVNCGQQPAIIMRRDRSIERLETTAPPLGLVRDWTGEQKTVELRSGDLLCVCSDGVIEAGLESGYEFGEDGLISVLATNPDQDIELTVARIAHAMFRYVPAGPTDDMTIVGIQAI
jgi:serine phosphatase RsbU (regulator of sigma subunit)